MSRSKWLACADAFKDRAEKTGAQHGVPADKCFVGYDGYKKLLESTDAELMLIAGPPGFRPVHFEAASTPANTFSRKSRWAWMRPGIRQFIAAGEKAKEKASLSWRARSAGTRSVYLRTSRR